MTDPSHLKWVEGLPQNHRKFLEKIVNREDYPRLLAGYANSLKMLFTKSKEQEVLRQMAIKAWELEPENLEIREIAAWALHRDAPMLHFRARARPIA